LNGGSRKFDVSELNLPSLSGSWIKWIILAVLAIVVLVTINWLRGVYTDYLWFDNAGYASVFKTILVTRIWLFFLGAGVFLLFIVPNVWLGFRFTRNEIPSTLTPHTFAVARKMMGLVSALVLGVAAISFGSAAASRWEMVLKYIYSTPFTTVNPESGVRVDMLEPIFNKGVDFYVFTLPLLGFMRGWVLGVLVVTLLIVAATYLIHRGLKEQGDFNLQNPKMHLAIIGSLIFLSISIGHWLSRYDLLYSGQGVLYGVGFTDENARIPVRTILTFVAAGSAILMLVGAYLNGYRLMIGAIGLWIGVSVLGGGVFPGLVQRFQVQPNELSKETQYLSNNIEMTRVAYGIDIDSEHTKNHKGLEHVTPEIIEENRGTIDNIRLWDERPLGEIYNQVEFIQFYYDFAGVGVDRYKTPDGKTTQVMLSSREINVEKLAESAQTWQNRHLVFTHGHGVAMSPINSIQDNGQPEMWLSNVPVEAAPGLEHLKLDEPALYYGLISQDFAIVNTDVKELDYQGEGSKAVHRAYEGHGGVALNSTIRRMAFSWEFGDVNILVSSEIDNSKSRIQYRRTVPERFSTIAPFLLPDSDPYQVVADGRVFFIQDGYSITDTFPYSTPVGSAFDQGPKSGGFNYIRNSVKAVVDAYTGDIDYYIFDDDDPMIQTYSKMFPDLFKGRDEMPDYLQEHIRYPRDIFTVQTRMLRQYHIEDPENFYQKGDQWSIPVQNSFGSEGNLDPYYILARLPGEETEEFLLIQPFTPDKRDPLKAWIAVRNDPPNYGEMVLFRFPGGKSILGPNQVEARIDNDAAISQQFTLWGQVGSEVQRGNMLVIPVGDAVLYAEPVFLKPQNLDFPELRRIILADGQKIVMQPTLEDAVRALKGEIPAVATAGSTNVSDSKLKEVQASPETEQTINPEEWIVPSDGVVVTADELESLILSLEELGIKMREVEKIVDTVIPKQ